MSQQAHFLSIEQLSASDSFILFYSSRILVRDQHILWNLDQLSKYLNDSADLILLERTDGSSVIAVSLEEDISEHLQAELNSLRSILFFTDQEKFLLAGRASQLIEWYKSHRFCGTCGSATTIIRTREPWSAMPARCIFSLELVPV